MAQSVIEQICTPLANFSKLLIVAFGIPCSPCDAHSSVPATQDPTQASTTGEPTREMQNCVNCQSIKPTSNSELRRKGSAALHSAGVHHRRWDHDLSKATVQASPKHKMIHTGKKKHTRHNTSHNNYHKQKNGEFGGQSPPNCGQKTETHTHTHTDPGMRVVSPHVCTRWVGVCI